MRLRAMTLVGVSLIAAPLLALPPTVLQPVESQWSVKLTTIGRGSGQARTVTIWFVHDNGRVYLQAGKDGQTDWYRNLLKTPQVTLDFGTLVVRGRARAIDDPSDVTRIHDLFLRKYLTARVASWFGGGFGTGKVVVVDTLEQQGT